MRRAAAAALALLVVAGCGSSQPSGWRAGVERPAAANSADRAILWTSCNELAKLSDRALDEWKRRGITGFVCQTGMLGDHRALLRRVAASAAVRRRDFDLYLGFYSTSSENRRAPFADWFDERAWRDHVLPAVQALAAQARSMRFRGMAIDQELYDTHGATWAWKYPGNRRGERATRAQAAHRGRQLGEAIQRGLP